MARVTTHTSRHGFSTQATRGLNFLEAVAPTLGAIAEARRLVADARAIVGDPAVWTTPEEDAS